MTIQKTIQRNEAGTRQTLDVMRQLARDGAAWPGQALKYFGEYPAVLDESMRQRWVYVPDGQHELIRTPGRMAADLEESGNFQGDCDDAAVWAAAALLTNEENVSKILLVAVRPAGEMRFTHVFVEVLTAGGWLRIDPTAPTDANYQFFERMEMEV